MRYTVYRTLGAYYFSPDISIDIEYWNTQHNNKSIDVQEGMDIHAAASIEIVLENATISQAYQLCVQKNGGQRLDGQDLPKDILQLQALMVEILGNRRLTLPELISATSSTLNLDDALEYAIQVLYLQQKINIQPAIQHDRNGRLYCMRCLQSAAVVSHDCGGCQQECYVCTACAAYGEARSCIPIVELTVQAHSQLLTSQSESNQSKYNQSQSNQPESNQLDYELSINSAIAPIYPHPLSADQQEASDRICGIVSNGNNALIWAVCGAGKTELIFQAIANVRFEAKNVLIATPRKDVVFELLPRLQKAFPKDSVHAVYGGSSDKHIKAGLTIATTHQLLRYQNRAFDVVIVDETDAFPYAGNQMLHEHVHRVGKQFVYMTATPDKHIFAQIQADCTVTLFSRYHKYPLPEPKWIMCSSIEAAGFDKLACRIKQCIDIANPIDKFSNSEPSLSSVFMKVLASVPNKGVTMIFVPSIAQGKRLQKLLEDNLSEDISLTFVYADDPQRIEKIAALREGRYQLIITTTILERGVTIPDSHVIVVDAHHPVFTKSTLIQIAGRVGRTVEHPDGQVIFLGKYLTKQIKAAIGEIKEINRFARRI
jgi:competence protein ComFA